MRSEIGWEKSKVHSFSKLNTAAARYLLKTFKVLLHSFILCCCLLSSYLWRNVIPNFFISIFFAPQHNVCSVLGEILSSKKKSRKFRKLFWINFSSCSCICFESSEEKLIKVQHGPLDEVEKLLKLLALLLPPDRLVCWAETNFDYFYCFLHRSYVRCIVDWLHH